MVAYRPAFKVEATVVRQGSTRRRTRDEHENNDRLGHRRRADGARLVPAAFAQGKTRDEVRQELIRAQHEGVVPAGKNDYPPSAALVARNKELHAISVHGGKTDLALDQHDQTVAR